MAARARFIKSPNNISDLEQFEQDDHTTSILQETRYSITPENISHHSDVVISTTVIFD